MKYMTTEESIIALKKNAQPKEVKFPCFMRSNKQVVLFTMCNIGTVVSSRYFQIGTKRRDWDMKQFTEVAPPTWETE